MIKILFICHGNICRSAMAEYVMRYLVWQENLSAVFEIDSAATSTEEIGNLIYPPAKAVLMEHQIPVGNHRARQINVKDYDRFDILIGMDEANLRNMRRLWPEDVQDKIHKLMDYTASGGEVLDPWYTRDFEATFLDVWEGCNGLLESLQCRI